MTRIFAIMAVCVALQVFWCSACGGDETSRYEVMLADGQRLYGQRLESWDNLGQLKLDGRPLTNPANHYRWIHNRKAKTETRPGTGLELVGGDVIPGEILKYVEPASDSVSAWPAHFEILPDELLTLSDEDNTPPVLSTVRVDARYVQRVIWRRQHGRSPDHGPGTAILRNGRVIHLRSATLTANGVRVLTDETVKTIAYAELRRLNLPHRDQWAGYFEELAAVDPQVNGRLERIETVGGAILTNSTARFRAANGGAESGLQMLQPAWSLGPILLGGDRVVQRSIFDPAEVPLSRFAPLRAVRRGAFAIGRTWRADRSVSGNPLTSGGRHHAWGFGVHAYNEMYFPLSSIARQFHSRFGLDAAAGQGGCARARIFLNEVSGRPLYESPLLIGSQAVSKTPHIELPNLSDAPRTLILQVDSAHEDRPRGADPLDVRDMFDWLEPIVSLDRELLRAEVGRRAGRHIPAWLGWTVGEGGGVEFRVTQQFNARQDGWGRYDVLIQPTRGPLVLTRKTTIGDDATYVIVDARGDGNVPADAIRLEANGRNITPLEFPQLQPWQKHSPPLAFPVSALRGQNVVLRIVQSEAGAPSLHWQTVNVAASAPREYRLQATLDRLGFSELAVNPAMGQLLSSTAIGPELKQKLLKISQLGCYVNLADRSSKDFDGDRVSNLLLGRFWKGGDEGCRLLEQLDDIPQLKLAADSKVSDAAIKRLQAAFPKMSVEKYDGTPPANSTHFRIRNRLDKEVEIYWVGFDNKLKSYGNVKANGQRGIHSYTGHRWEAHADGARVAEYVVGPILTWKID
ncbi:MAG: NPCBM/NEW2 domain-containing protein [Pirellulales bacterium]